MKKGRVVGLLKNAGDAILTFRNSKDKAVTYHLCTLDFKNKYIKTRTRGKKPWPKNKTDIVVFDWTDNRYWIFNPNDILKIQPLGEVLQNVRDPT